MRNPTFGIIIWLGRLMRLPQLSYICIVMLRLKTLTILGSRAELASLPDGKLLINTVNAHSFNTAQKDSLFAEALQQGDVLIPDGVSIVKVRIPVDTRSPIPVISVQSVGDLQYRWQS